MLPGFAHLSPSSIPGSDAALHSQTWLRCAPLLKSWHLLLLAWFWILTLPELWYCISGINLPTSDIWLLILPIKTDLDCTHFSVTLLPQFNGNPFCIVTRKTQTIIRLLESFYHVLCLKIMYQLHYFTIRVLNGDWRQVKQKHFTHIYPIV